MWRRDSGPRDLLMTLGGGERLSNVVGTGGCGCRSLGPGHCGHRPRTRRAGRCEGQQRKTLRGHGCLSIWGLVHSPTEHPGAVHSEHGPRGSREHGSPERNQPVSAVSLLGPCFHRHAGSGLAPTTSGPEVKVLDGRRGPQTIARPPAVSTAQEWTQLSAQHPQR